LNSPREEGGIVKQGKKKKGLQKGKGRRGRPPEGAWMETCVLRHSPSLGEEGGVAPWGGGRMEKREKAFGGNY